ncbi:hypothetical protein [Actinoplanes ianthinogenes]|uniref:hypothetical protein n=1 Tax=Actinoplanes ianthinogenes TaxID=122358 RepID=UPI00167006CC|nr:hypothetical protein [Actinoplanes ianthinogenes]
MNTSRGITFAWLGHPSTVVALAVLVINDHLLKATFPGPLTGKLSDVAGLVLAPPLLAVLATLIAPRLSARRTGQIAMLTVAAGFGLVKAFPYAAQLASAAWSLVTPSLVRADVTDLLALPALAVSWWSLGRAHRTPVRLGPRRFRALRVAVLLPLALTGVAATSASYVFEAQRVEVADGRIYLGAGYSWGEVKSWGVSRDGGRTWTRAEAPPAGDREPESCAGEVCYRAAPGALGVQSRAGYGPWTTSWGFGPRDRWTLYRAYGDLDDIDRQLSTVDVVTAPAAGGYLVAAANGRDGFALRDTTGAWHRIGFPWLGDERLVPYQLPDDRVLSIDRWYAGILAGFLTVAALLIGCVQIAKRAGAQGKAWELATPVLLLGPPVLLLEVLGRADPNQVMGWLGFAGAVPLAGLSAIVLVVALTRTVPRLVRRGRWLGGAALVTGLAAAADLLIFEVWTDTGVEHVLPLILGDLAVFGLSLLALHRLAASAGVTPWPPMRGPLWLTGRVM